MADLPTRAELFEIGRDAVIGTPNTRISVEQIDKPGSNANLLLAMMSLLAETVSNRAGDLVLDTFEETAEGDALSRLVGDRKNIKRLPATPAVVTLSLSRASAAAGAGSIVGGLPGSSPSIARIRNNRGIVYTLLETASFGALDLGPVTVLAQAEIAGLDYEVDRDQTWQFLTAVFDSSIVVSNAETAAGADDAEDDDRLRSRSKRFYPSLRRGTKQAILYGIRDVPGVASGTVEEIVGADGTPAGQGRGYVLDILGNANQALADRAQLALVEYRALGVPVPVYAGSTQYVPIEFANLDFDTDLVADTTDAFDRVKLSIIAALENQQSGQKLYRSTILAAARKIAGVIVEDEDLIEPVGTLTPAASVSLRSRRELITVSL